MSHAGPWRRIEERAVLRAWAIAEATSQKEGFAPLTDAEWRILENAIRQYRAPMIADLPRLGVEWYEGEVPVTALWEMRFFKMPDWVRKAPSQKLGDLVGTRQKGGTDPEFRGFATVIERPIAVGVSLDGPLCLLEGYTRCGAILRDHEAGLSTLGQVPVIVGVSPRIAEWTNGQGHRWW